MQDKRRRHVDQDITASLEFAAACGAISTRGVGGVDGQPTFDEATAGFPAIDVARLHIDAIVEKLST